MRFLKTIYVDCDGFEEALKQARESSPMTVIALAEASGVTPSHWYQIEAGNVKALPEPTLRRIEKALGVDFGIVFPVELSSLTDAREGDR